MMTIGRPARWLRFFIAAALVGCGESTPVETDGDVAAAGTSTAGTGTSAGATGAGGSTSASTGGSGGHSDPELDAFLEAQLEAGNVPALSALVMHGGEITWSGAYGLADIEHGKGATTDTLFLLASISKTIVATALMQLEEQGKLALDDNVETFVPFDVRHPGFPSAPITVHMLVTHTSGIRDNWDVLDANYVPGDSPIALGDFVEGYLTPGGPYFDSNENFGEAPGTAYDYSNVAVTLAAYVVEAVSGEPFDAYCKKHVFDPLGMIETSWRIADLDPKHVAMPYQHTASGFDPYGYYGYPDYPDGLLRTSAPQLARFLSAFMQGGTYEGATILSAESAALMKQPQIDSIDPEQGIVWYYDQGHTTLGHTGGDLGVSTSMFYRPADGDAVIFFMNAEPPDAQYFAIEERLWEKAAE